MYGTMYGTMEPQGGDDMKRIYTEIRIHHQTAEEKKRFERQLDDKIKAAGFGSRAEYFKVMTLNSNIGVATNAREDVKMKTAREFLEHCGYEVNEENLYALTRYAGDNTNIDFSQFPDAAIPDEILEDAEMEANFQDWMDGRR